MHQDGRPPRHGSGRALIVERPRVLIVVTLSELGGAQSCVARLLPGLVDEFDVVVAAAGEGPLAQAVETAGARFVRLRRMQRRLGPGDLAGLAELVSLIRRERPALVHAHSSKAGILARAAAAACGVPVRVFTSHGWAFQSQRGPFAPAYLAAERIAARLTTMVVCPAETELETGLRERCCRPGAATVIRTGIEPAGQPVATARLHPQIVTVGRLKAPKDLGTLVEAIALLRDLDVRLLVAGDGPQREVLERRTEERGLSANIRFLGSVEDAHELVAGADCFVLSSRSECLPVSILEAMAAGVPVVASAVGGIPELLDGGNAGLLFRPGDAEGLAAALRAVLEDRELARRLGEAGRRKASSSHGLDDYRRSHVELYRSLLEAA